MEFPSSKFQLVGIITHNGDAATGHYSAYAKNISENEWWYFNDAYTHAVDEKFITDKLRVQSRDSQIISPVGFNELGSPYMLIYRKYEVSDIMSCVRKVTFEY